MSVAAAFEGLTLIFIESRLARPEKQFPSDRPELDEVP